MNQYIEFCLKNFHVICLSSMSILLLIYMALLLTFRKKNEELFNSLPFEKFCELVLNKIFLDGKGITDENKVTFSFEDIFVISFIFSLLPALHFFVLCEIIIFIPVLFITDKSLQEIYDFLNKDVSSDEDYLSNENKDILLLKKYNKDNNIENIITAITNESHPYREVINDNLKKLIDIINNKEFELETTFNITKKEQIQKEINSLISKYISLINGIDANMINEDLSRLKDLDLNVADMLTYLRSNEFELNLFIEKYKDMLIFKHENLTDYSPEFIMGTMNYLEGFKPNNEFEKLKKILSNDRTMYYNMISNLIVLSANNIRNLDSKLNFLSLDAKKLVLKNITDCLLSLSLLVLELDSKNNIDLGSNNDVNNYNDLIDSILDDVKNKRAIF